MSPRSIVAARWRSHCAHTITSRRKRTASTALPIGMIEQHDPGRDLQHGRLERAARRRPSRLIPRRTRQHEGDAERNQVAEERADALPELRHRLDADVDIDMGAARHRPRGAEEGDVDQCVFDDLDAADDRAVEDVAQRHVDADQRAAGDQDRDGELAEDVLDATSQRSIGCSQLTMGGTARDQPSLSCRSWCAASRPHRGARSCSAFHSTS